MKKTLLTIALMACGACAVAADADASKGFYGGAGIGQLDYSESLGAGFSFSDKSVTWKPVLGYSFNRYFGAEASYLKAGTLSNTYRSGSSSATVSLDVTGWEFSVVARFGSPEFSGFLRAGGVSYDAKAKVSGTGISSAAASDSGNDAIYGVGFQSEVSPNVILRGEVEYAKVGDATLKLPMASILFKF